MRNNRGCFFSLHFFLFSFDIVHSRAICFIPAYDYCLLGGLFLYQGEISIFVPINVFHLQPCFVEY